MPQFTKETAAEMARRSHLPGSARFHSEPEPAPDPQPAVIPAEPDPDYTAVRLMRVRKQLDRLDALAAEETDPKRCKEFADATSRLQEQERQLANRPLPGTLKPSQPKAQRTRATPEPTLAQPTAEQPKPTQGNPRPNNP